MLGRNILLSKSRAVFSSCQNIVIVLPLVARRYVRREAKGERLKCFRADSSRSVCKDEFIVRLYATCGTGNENGLVTSQRCHAHNSAHVRLEQLEFEGRGEVREETIHLLNALKKVSQLKFSHCSYVKNYLSHYKVCTFSSRFAFQNCKTGALRQCLSIKSATAPRTSQKPLNATTQRVSFNVHGNTGTPPYSLHRCNQRVAVGGRGYNLYWSATHSQAAKIAPTRAPKSQRQLT